MGWKDRLQPGSFRGVRFYVDEADRQIGRRSAIHEYPFRDLPYVEDLGKKSRVFTFQAFVIGDDYDHDRDALIDALETAGPGVLVHPYYGEFTVSVNAENTVTDSKSHGGMAKFQLSFIESAERSQPASTPDTVSAVDTATQTAGLTLDDEFANQFDVSGSSFLLDDATAKINALTGELMGMVSGSGLGQLFAIQASFSQFKNALTDLLALPSSLASSVRGLISSFSGLSPKRQISLMGALANSHKNATLISSATTPQQKQAILNSLAVDDLVRRTAILEAVRASATFEYPSFDEATAQMVQLADLLDAELDIASPFVYPDLIDVKAAMVADVSERSANLARVQRVTLAQTLPALVVAYRLYQDASRADEIITRNSSISHPGFVQGGMALEVLTA